MKQVTQAELAEVSKHFSAVVTGLRAFVKRSDSDLGGGAEAGRLKLDCPTLPEDIVSLERAFRLIVPSWPVFAAEKRLEEAERRLREFEARMGGSVKAAESKAGRSIKRGVRK
jgi:hypothetical protein